MKFNLDDLIKNIRSNKLYQYLYSEKVEDKNIIIFDIGTKNIKYFFIELGKEKPVIKYSDVIKIDLKKNNDYSVAVKSTIRDVMYGKPLDNTKVAVILSGQQITNRFIIIPKIPDDELSTAIDFEVKKMLHVSAEDVMINHKVVERFTDEKGREKLKIFIAVIKHDDIKELEEVFKELGLPISILTVDSILYGHIYTMSRYKDERVAFVDVGAENTNFNIVKDGMLEFSRNIPMGGNAITELIAKDLSGSPTNFREFVDESEIEKIRSSLFTNESELEKLEEKKKTIAMSLTDGIARIMQRVRLTIGYFKTQVKGKSIDRVVLCGGSSNITNIAEVVSSSLDVKTETLNIEFSNIFDSESELMEKRIAENILYFGPVLAVSELFFKKEEILNFYNAKNKDKIELDVIFEKFPEPKIIFSIAAGFVVFYFSVIGFMQHRVERSRFNSLKSVKSMVQEYNTVESDMKYRLRTEIKNMDNVKSWLSSFVAIKKNWNGLFDFLAGVLPEKSFIESFELKSKMQSIKVTYTLEMVIMFEDPEEFKNFKFLIENRSVWDEKYTPRLVTSKDTLIRKDNLNLYKLIVDAELQ
ncbi:MAG: hypothetical protein C0601_01960 [Candidatus Muiribacterium halophilum]|uniref:SHS2 domain-containing protein n=1 Tax=Muiribacterium halophilum TaxID=2053465 RepID=A0A2N5ZKY4_MUIH1|nr:MAG: hypothetical protein C0601_01960 [Candidatus Muirbacterium halophilum]